jgi:hypothetical protein
LVTLIALFVRFHMNKRDAAIVVAGSPYSRKFHVFAETRFSEANSNLDFTTIKQYLMQKNFRVVSAGAVLAATSPLWKMWPVFVWVTREHGCTIRVYDRFLQPVMVPFVERRFQRRVSELAEQLRETVEQICGADGV